MSSIAATEKGPDVAANDGVSPAAFSKIPFWRTFHFRLSLVFGIPLVALIVVMGLFAYHSLVQTRLENFRQRLFSVALALAQTIDVDQLKQADLDSQDDPEWLVTLRSRLQEIVDREQDIESIYIMLPTENLEKLRFLIDASGQTRVAKKGEYYDATEIPFMLKGFEDVAVEDRVYSDSFGDTQSSYAPLRNHAGAVVGLVGVDVLSVSVDAIRNRVLWFCVMLFGSAVVVVTGLSLAVSRWVRAPLGHMFAAADAVARGDLDRRIDLRREDELGALAGQFDNMTERLRQQRCLRETFGVYVSRDLAARLLQNGEPPVLGGEECVATIMFLDLCGYTHVSERLTPNETVEMLNQFLGAMIEIVEAHEGCVLDIMGDAMIAVFGAPLPLADHAARAVDCSLRLREELTRLNREWERAGLARRWHADGIAEIEMRIGLHTGRLTVGNIGSRSRMKFSVIGDTVNIAARLEQLNKELNTSILFSGELKVLLPPGSTPALIDHGYVAVRGRRQPIRVWSV